MIMLKLHCCFLSLTKVINCVVDLQAILGGKLRVPGIHGEIELSIPPGTQSHQKLRLSGRGIPRLNGMGKGDHFVNFKIHIPK